MELLKSKTGRILIEAHRGAEGLAPENSWPALEAGRKSGADLLEVDIQLSQDGVAFLQHHYTLPDGRRCSATPWSEIKNLRIREEALPPLEDVLGWAREQAVCLSLDLKTAFTPSGRLRCEILRLLERTGTSERVVLLGWDHQELLELKRGHPELTTRALIRGRLVDYPGFLKSTRADAVSLSYDLAQPRDIEQIHEAGVAVAVCEMWQPDFEYVKQTGADMVSWSDPAQARRLLE